MNEFTYKSKYGTYHRCSFAPGYYSNGNLALEIWSAEEGPITKVTVNPDIKILPNQIAVKDYSENEGMSAWLEKMKIIEDRQHPVRVIKSGYVTIPVYQLTELGMSIFK